LSDLGFKGRPTLELCKKVKRARELEAERNELNPSLILPDDAKGSRREKASLGLLKRVMRAPGTRLDIKQDEPIEEGDVEDSRQRLEESTRHTKRRVIDDSED
jgi:hypothetical protein